MPETHSQSWSALADTVLAGSAPTRDEALSVLRAPDDEMLAVLDAAFRVRRRYFGKQVQLYYLVNAKSGLCPEDCGYCSQSRISSAEIERYPFLSRDELLEGAGRAAKAGACTYCIVASGRGPTDREVDHVAETVREIKDQYGLRICACLGILKDGQAQRLRAAGVDRFNHNLNTSEAHHASICSTHGYEDRTRTLEEVKAAGISPCSGGIIGMGERMEDVVDLAFSLRELEVESIPVNFYHPIPGPPLAHLCSLNPRYCLKALAMFRFVNPTREIRMAGGRELHLGSMQAMGLYAANSLFISDYLTTPGQGVEADHKMLRELGFEVVGVSRSGTEEARERAVAGVAAAG
jgi:biotin synthase